MAVALAGGVRTVSTLSLSLSLSLSLFLVWELGLYRGLVDYRPYRPDLRSYELVENVLREGHSTSIDA
jgi:hypothetical protein